MKRIFSILLALTLMVTLAVPAFATETEISPKSGDSFKDVTATYTAAVSNDGGKVYYFTINWAATSSSLKYEGKNATYKWDGENMIYKETVNNSSTMGWTGSAGYKVTVTNKSNDAVTVTTSATTKYNLTATAEGEQRQTAGSAAMKNGEVINFTNTDDKGTATIAEVTYTYSDEGSATAPDDVATNGQFIVGKITVTVTHS